MTAASILGARLIAGVEPRHQRVTPEAWTEAARAGEVPALDERPVGHEMAQALWRDACEGGGLGDR